MPKRPSINLSVPVSETKTSTLVDRLNIIRERAQQYFDHATTTQKSDSFPSFQELKDPIIQEAREIECLLHALLGEIASAMGRSPFTSDGDYWETKHAHQGMYWALQFHKYEHRHGWVESDEDRIVMVHPEKESHEERLWPAEAKAFFDECAESLNSRLRFVDSQTVEIPKHSSKLGTTRTPQENASKRRALVKSTALTNPRMKGKGLDKFTCIELDYANIRILEEWRSDTITTWEKAYNNSNLKPRIQKMFSSDRQKSQQ